MRCVHCGRLKGAHAPETLVCPGSAEGVYSTMELPAGATCADCLHFKRTCSWLLSRNGTEASCDWWPVRFVRITAEVEHA
jgi:hypothetical protein